MRGGSWQKEFHDVDVNFGRNVTCAWIFAVAPQFFNCPAGWHPIVGAVVTPLLDFSHHFCHGVDCAYCRHC